MDSVPKIYSHEARAVIKQVANKLGDGTSLGSFSLSVYNIAWLARIVTRGSNPEWLFPQCFTYLLQAQEVGGGWPSSVSETDDILNTMSALAALREHQKRSEITCGCSALEDIPDHIAWAENHLKATLQNWDVPAIRNGDFEILVPALLNFLDPDETLHFPGRQTLMFLNRLTLAAFCPEMLYAPQKTTLIRSLEAFVNKIDFDRVAHHLDERGSMMASPSATAAYLMHCSTWDEAAAAFLQGVVTSDCGMGSDGVPSTFPSSIFEISSIVSTLLKSGLTAEILGMEETSKIGAFLHLHLDCHGGIIDTFLEPDAVNSAKAILAANLLGLPVSARRLVDEFEKRDHFRMYEDGQGESLSANCNVLEALLHCPRSVEYVSHIIKAAQFLCKAFYSRNNTRDEWSVPEQYMMMTLSQAFVKLLHSWEIGSIGDLPDDLLRDKVPIMLFQILVRTLQTQLPHGSWSSRTTSREITAYAVITLKTLSKLPWLSQFEGQIDAAIKRASAHLIGNHDLWDQHEYLWTAKVTYALPSLTRAYIIAALYASVSYKWSDKVISLAKIPGDKVHKLAKFFSQLPMFTDDELWLLEADVALGYLYQAQLLRVESSIFPRQERLDYKYLEYIPFTWIAPNRKNNYPLSNNLLWEMMKIALLDYQLDEFMEILFDQNEPLEQIDHVRSIARNLCEFQSTADKHHSGSSTSTKAESVLRRFTSYVFQHAAVVQAPEYVRRQLHNELATCILAHIDHDQDNARFAAQTREHTVATYPAKLTTRVLPFTSPRSSYHSWIRTTSADDTHSPFTFQFFTCLAATPGESFFRGVRQHYLANAASRHLANLCRQYNDYGSLARDLAEGNLNSLNFPEFHEAYNSLQADEWAAMKQEADMKQDLLFICEYERECQEDATKKLMAEIRRDVRGEWKSQALQAFIDTVNLYGQIYIARDITNRVK